MPRQQQNHHRVIARWRYLLCVLTVSASTALTLSPKTTLAQEERSPDAEEHELYLQGVLKQAKLYFDRGDYTACIPLMEEVNAFREHIAIHQRLAIAYEHVGRISQAVKAHRRILEIKPDHSKRGRILQEIRRLDALTKTTVQIQSEPSGFEVYRDNEMGSFLGVTPLTLTQPAGPMTVYLTSPGYRPETRSLKLVEGKGMVLSISATRLAAGITVSSHPTGAIVQLSTDHDHEILMGETPLTRRYLTPGEYLLEVTSPDHEPFIERVVISGEEIISREIRLTPIHQTIKDDLDVSPWSVGLLVTGGVTLIGSAGLWVWTRDAIEEINTYDTRDPTHSRAELQKMEADIPSLKAATWLTAGVGTAALGAGLLMVWFDDNEHAPLSPASDNADHQEQLTFVPTGDSGGLIVWQGHY